MPVASYKLQVQETSRPDVKTDSKWTPSSPAVHLVRNAQRQIARACGLSVDRLDFKSACSARGERPVSTRRLAIPPLPQCIRVGEHVCTTNVSSHLFLFWPAPIQTGSKLDHQGMRHGCDSPDWRHDAHTEHGASLERHVTDRWLKQHTHHFQWPRSSFL